MQARYDHTGKYQAKGHTGTRNHTGSAINGHRASHKDFQPSMGESRRLPAQQGESRKLPAQQGSDQQVPATKAAALPRRHTGTDPKITQIWPHRPEPDTAGQVTETSAQHRSAPHMPATEAATYAKRHTGSLPQRSHRSGHTGPRLLTLSDGSPEQSGPARRTCSRSWRCPR
jgi:hypothetical protein